MALKISEEAAVQMPMKTVASLITMVAIGTWAYFGIIETQNKLSTQVELMSKDLTENTEFRIKWPRGQLGSLPADSEQFMLIEELYKQVEKLQIQQESGMHNKVNIEFLTKQLEKALEDIEELKDSNREIHYKNGNGGWNMEEIVIALLMIVNQEIKEHRIQPNMSTCLKGKRVAERDSKSHVQYQCIKSLAETEIYLGEKSIVKLILK